MTPADVLFLAGAGVLAGVANTVAGGGTFIAYPALIFLGLPPISANVTSAVGLVSGYAGGALSFRRELEGQWGRMRALLPTVLIGSVGGAVLLLFTPDTTFTAIVPFMVLAACLLLAVQPRVRASVERTRGDSGGEGSQVGPALLGAVLIASVYGSFFGAGLGVMLLAILASLIADGLQRINGLRQALSLGIKGCGVLIFLFSGKVSWLIAAILFVTAFFGGSIGAVLTRRLSEGALRWTVIVAGVAVAIGLFLA